MAPALAGAAPAGAAPAGGAATTFGGTVLDAAGAPLAGVAVQLSTTDGPERHGETVTGADGRWSLSEVPGDYCLHYLLEHEGARYPFAHGGTCRISVGSGGTAEELSAALAGTEVGGAVVGPGGAPGPGADVHLVPVWAAGRLVGSSRSATTDAAGRWTAHLVPPGEYHLRVEAPAGSGWQDRYLGTDGNLATATTVTVPGGGAPAVAPTATLAPAPRLTGRVVTGDGTPAAGADVWVWPAGSGDLAEPVPVATATTGADGTYAVGLGDAVPGTYDLTLLPGTWALAGEPVAVAVGTADLVAPDLVAVRTGEVQGTVDLGEGDERSGDVLLVGEDGRLRYADRVSGTGVVGFGTGTSGTSVPPGTYRVQLRDGAGRVWWAGGVSAATARPVEVRPGETTDGVVLRARPQDVGRADVPPELPGLDPGESTRRPAQVAAVPAGGTVTVPGLEAWTWYHVRHRLQDSATRTDEQRQVHDLTWVLADGSGTAAVPLPPTLPVDEHVLFFTADGPPGLAGWTPVTVVPPAGPSAAPTGTPAAAAVTPVRRGTAGPGASVTRLPDTGAVAGGGALVAGGLLAAGALLLGVARRGLRGAAGGADRTG
ncbi:carboxypeptidase-like regulatory domain-containing protein [Cellulomonas endophytica]|uniref:carboxypeptidase-like regulatory domain-containing protein n=1 Tax=Cellulomonas endophytica TaxID=2494735 RepID=UPI0013E975F9|nr:carboxypeptidase-like regulatory domain-containing protein [Cellulomonas endophytica]